MKWHNGFDEDRLQVSRDTMFVPSGVSRTVQSMKDEADINVLVRRFGLTGQMPVNVRVPEYGDFDVVADYQSAMNAILMAESSFMAMPADVRKRFNHSPQEFLEFCANPENLEEMRKLGLAVPAEPVEPTPPVEPVTPQ